MVAPVFKPLSVGAGWVAVSLYIEAFLISSVPVVIVLLTSVGPFVPLVASAIDRRREISEQDSDEVFKPLYSEIKRNKEHILAAKRNGQAPMFEKAEIDRIRLTAPYEVVKNKTPKADDFFKTMDFISENQGSVSTAIRKIIRGIVQSYPSMEQYNGDGISLSGKNLEGSKITIPHEWMPFYLMQDVDPLDYWRQHMTVISMDIVDNRNNVMGSVPLPTEENTYRRLWGKVKEMAEKDSQINKMHSKVSRLPTLEIEAESQVLHKVRKSRSVFQ